MSGLYLQSMPVVIMTVILELVRWRSMLLMYIDFEDGQLPEAPMTSR